MNAPGTVSFGVNVNFIDGFAQTVFLNILGMPRGMSASWAPDAKTATLTAAGTVPSGTYPLTLSGTGGGLTRTATIPVSVTNIAPPAPPPPPPAARDRTAPTVLPVPASGQVGKRLMLRFRVSDHSGYARVKATVARGTTTLLQKAVAANGIRSGRLMAIAWTPRKAGKYRLCVKALDRGGNASSRRCSNITIRR